MTKVHDTVGRSCGVALRRVRLPIMRKRLFLPMLPATIALSQNQTERVSTFGEGILLTVAGSSYQVR